MDAYWRDDAACSTATAHLFDPVDTTDRTDGGAARLKRARILCRTCPAAAPCLAEGRRDRGDGLRAGVYLIDGEPVKDPRPQRKRSKIELLRGVA